MITLSPEARLKFGPQPTRVHVEVTGQLKPPAATLPPPKRLVSPEAQRQSFIFLAAIIGACLSVYAMVLAKGDERLILAAMTGLWLALSVNSVRANINETRAS